jgi:hypothetical protein
VARNQTIRLLLLKIIGSRPRRLLYSIEINTDKINTVNIVAPQTVLPQTKPKKEPF